MLGFLPGKSIPSDVTNFTETFGNTSLDEEISVFARVHEHAGGVSLDFVEDETDIGITYAYYEDGGKLDQLALTTSATVGEGANSEFSFGNPLYSSLLSYFLPTSLVPVYGQPSEVLVAVFPDEPGSAPQPFLPFSTVVVYEHASFLIEYVVPAYSQGPDFVGCPSEGHFGLTSWQPRTTLFIEDVVSPIAGLGINRVNVGYFLTLLEATGKSLDEFTSAFYDPIGDGCLRTPRTLWPPQ